MRRLRLLRLIGIAFSLAALAAGCAEDEALTPVEQCNEVAKTECKRIFACTTEAERTAQGLPPSFNELACAVTLAGPTQLACETATAEKICAGAQTYTASQAQACISEANQATCDTIKSNFPNVDPYAKSCGQCVPKF